MFEIGRCVCYRAEGVCRITDIREESFGTSTKTLYYVLTPVHDEKSTVYVPTDNELLVSRMRALLTAKEICELVESLREVRMDWIPESRARNAKFREILGDGDRDALIVLLLTLLDRAGEGGKKPSTVDENAARRAKKLLLEEFSATTDLSTEEDLVRFLRGEILCGDKKESK